VVPIIYIIIFYPAELAIAPIIFTILFLIALKNYNKKLGPVTVQLRTEFGEMDDKLNESLTGIELIKSTAQEMRQSQKYLIHAGKYRDAYMQEGKIQAKYTPLLILAIAISFDLSGRLQSELAGAPPMDEGADKGKLQWPPVIGFSVVTLAAAVGAAKILNLDEQQIAEAIGIAGCICPPNIFRKWTDTAPVKMTKYGPSGWGAQAGVTSALLAEMGYTGDTDLFDGEYGFWRYTGQEAGRIEDAIADLGLKWRYYQMKYKQYPCGG